MRLALRAEKISPSVTLTLAATAKQLRATGKDIVSFAVGEPDFDTPVEIKNIAKEALDKGETHYSASAGIAELRAAVADKLHRDNNLNYVPEEIVITTGAKIAIYNLFHLLLDDGDEIIIPAPYWVSYLPQVKIIGGVAKIVSCGRDTGFKITARQIAEVATEKTRAIIINSPCNPTGAVYTKGELEAIAEICAQKNITVISDEIYEKLVYDEAKHFSIASFPGMKDKSVVVNGLSKSYAMTGWRLGYVAAPGPVAKKLAAMIGQQTSCVSPFIQAAALYAIECADVEVIKMRQEFAKRRDFFISELRKISKLEFDVPNGAFYIWVDVRSFLGSRMESSLELAKMLLEKMQLAVVPGEAFGYPGFLRLSYAASHGQIEKGVSRLAEGLSELS